jgi:hypothetical protein
MRDLPVLLSTPLRGSRNSAGIAVEPAALRVQTMRRHDTQILAVLAALFLVSIAIGLRAWL